MLIKFKLLWIENEKGFITRGEKNLGNFLKDLGFALEVERILNPNDLISDKLIEIFDETSQYDLILVDWMDSDDNKVGGEVIEKIRNKELYTDIIFYSGNGNVLADFKKKGLEGVFIANRVDLTRIAKELITYLLRKSLHPRVMRGIIVSSLSEIDKLVFNIIKLKYGASDKTLFSNAIKKSLKEQYKAKHKKLDEILNYDNDAFIDKLESTIYYDSMKRIQKLIKLFSVDKANNPKIKAIIENPDFKEFSNYIAAIEELVKLRNKLTHWKHVNESNSHILLSDGNTEQYNFDEVEATRLRKMINNGYTALDMYFEQL